MSKRSHQRPLRFISLGAAWPLPTPADCAPARPCVHSFVEHTDQLRGPRRLAVADLVSCIRLFGGPFLPLDGFAGSEVT